MRFLRRVYNGKPIGMRVYVLELISTKEEIHGVADITYIDTRFVALENMLKGFVLSQSPTNSSPP